MFGTFSGTERTANHVARHGLEEFEVEEVCYGFHLGHRLKPGIYRAIGPTDAGRYLTIYLSVRGRKTYYVLTAREASDAERRLFRRSTGR